MKPITTKTHIDYAHFESKSGDAQNLKSVSRWADFRCWRGQAPKLESIGGFVSFRDWQGQAPNLTHIEEEYLENNWSRLKKIYNQTK